MELTGKVKRTECSTFRLIYGCQDIRARYSALGLTLRRNTLHQGLWIGLYVRQNVRRSFESRLIEIPNSTLEHIWTMRKLWNFIWSQGRRA